MSDSMRPHRQQPTRLPHPWDSLGKNTGVGCHFLLQCMKVKNENEVIQSCPTLSDPMDHSLPGSSVQGIFQARVLEWGGHCLLQNCPIGWVKHPGLFSFKSHGDPLKDIKQGIGMTKPVFCCHTVAQSRLTLC